MYSKMISSPIGELYLVATELALVSLDNHKNDLYNRATSSKNHSVLNRTHAQLNEYFNGKRFEFDLPLAPYGSPFQVKVWNALREIPYGDVWSYGQQAKFIKSPKAFRAVGAANGKNPLPIIIPCHRVVGSSGKLIGYSGGIEMKINLLKHEGHQIDGLQLVKY